MGPKILGNPLHISTYLLIFSYVFGEFIFPKYPLLFIINLVGFSFLIISPIIFFSSRNAFFAHEENPVPQSDTDKIIKTGIYAYSRNPIYLSFVLFHLGMFLTFENVMYFLCSIALFYWLDHFIIVEEERYLNTKFKDEYKRYCNSVKRWILF